MKSEDEQQIVIQKMLVTPTIAKGWLAQDNQNYRVPDEHVIDGLARAMSAGEWKLTPQGISFDPEGLLIDGQHRLYAIVKSGVSVWMFVAFNVPKETELVIDNNKPRRFRDHAKYQGLWYRESAIALAKVMNNPKTLTYNPIRLQPFEQLELVNRFKTGIEFVLHYKTRYVRAAVLAPIAMAHYYPEYRDCLPRFMELLYSGKSSDPKESSVTSLRDVALIRRERNNAMLFAKSQAAVDAFNKGRPLSKLYARGYDLDTGSLTQIFFPLKMDSKGKIVPDR